MAEQPYQRDLYSETPDGYSTGQESFGTKDFLKLGGILAAYPLIMGIMGKGLGFAQAKMSRGIATRLASRMPKSRFARAQGLAADKPGRVNPPTLSETVDSLPKDIWIRQFKRNFQARQLNLSRDYARWKNRTEQYGAQNARMSPIRKRALRAQDFLSQNTYDKMTIMRGAGIEHASHYLRRSVAFYGADRIIGGLTGHRDRPNVWNVPGTMLDYAKFTAGFYPIDAFLMGGGAILKYGIAGKAASAFKDKIARISPDQRARASKRSGAIYDNIVAAGKGTAAGFKKANPVASWGDLGSAAVWENYFRPSKWQQNFKRFSEGFKKDYNQQREVDRAKRRSKSYLDDRYRDMISTLSRGGRQMGPEGTMAGMGVDAIDVRRRFYQELKRRSAERKPNFWEDLLGLERAKLNKRDAQKMVKEIRQSGVFGKSPSASIEKKIVSNIYYQEPIYSLGPDTVLDLRAMSPRKILAAATQKAKMIPGIGVLVGIAETGVRTIGDRGIAAHLFGPGEAATVGHISSRVRPDVGISVEHKALAPQEGQAGMFFLGKFYLMSRGEMTAVNPEQSYKMLRGGQGTYFSNSINKHYGYPMKDLKSVEEMSRIKGWRQGFIGSHGGGAIREWMHKNIFRKYEFGAGYGESQSAMEHVRGMQTKYTELHSILNLLGADSKVFTESFITGMARDSLTTTQREGSQNMAMIALEQIAKFIGKSSINATQVITKRPGMFKGLLRGEMQLGPGVSIDVAKALEDPQYLWKITQKINPRDTRLFRGNEKVANTINAVQGKSFDQFKQIMADPTAKGYRTYGEGIDKLEETRQFLVNKRLVERTITSEQFDAVTRTAEKEGLSFIRRSEREALEMFTFKNNLLKTIASAKRNQADPQVVEEALREVMAYKDPLYKVAKNYIPWFSSGHVKDYTRVNPDPSPVLSALENSPYVAIPDNFIMSGLHKMPAMERGLFSMFPRVTKGMPENVGDDPRYAMTRLAMLPAWLTDRLVRVGEFTGFSPSPDSRRSVIDTWKIFGKWGIGVAGVYGAYQGADTLIDINPAFDGTMFDEGLTVAMAEQTVKGKLVFDSFRDISGLTSMSKYLEGLMPGSIDSPLAGITRTVAPMALLTGAGSKIGGSRGAAAGAAVGGALGFTEMSLQAVTGSLYGSTGGLLATMSRDEFEEEFSGREEVPVRRGRWWELSRQNYSGRDIMYYRPNWFARLKSQYEYTPDGLGYKSEAVLFENPPLGINPIGAAIDPYHYERKHYLSRPYPETGGIGEAVPFIGPAISRVTASAPIVDPFNLPFTKPNIRMHSRHFERTYEAFDRSRDPAALTTASYSDPSFDRQYDEHFMSPNQGGPGIPGTPGSPAVAGVRSPPPMSSTSLGATLGNLEYRGIIEPLGLIGFGYESLAGRLQGESGRRGFFEPNAVMENASEMNSFRRRYWDLSIGGQFGTTEFWRRLVPRRPFNTEYYNMIPNRMPGWMNTTDNFINFAYGDPYTKIPEGLLRLPGSGYEAARSVVRTFPGRASWVGHSAPEIVERMIGITPPMDDEGFDITSRGTYLHQAVQDQLARENLLISAEAMVFEPWSNISGHIDAIIRDGKKKKVVEIKTISTEALLTMTAPRSQHYGQVNFYMKASGIYSGQVLYVSRDDPRLTRAFDVYYSHSRFKEDVSKMLQARGIALELRAQKLGFAGEDYSHLDRLAILADVAPYSKNYKEELQIVRTQGRLGILSDREKSQMQNILKHRRSTVQKKEFYPYRFKGKILSPDVQFETMNHNENLKAAAEYSLPERVVGSAWEMFCLPADEPVETHRGYIPANRVCENDLVRTHTGEWKAIEQVHVRESNSHDVMKHIRAGGHDVPLRVTANHKIWTEEGFVSAGDIRRGDVLLYPPVKIKPGSDELDVTDVIANLIPVEVDGVQFYRKKHSNKLFPSKIKKTQAMMRLFGYYMARGGTIRDEGRTHGFRIGFKSDMCKADALTTLSEYYVQATSQTIKSNDYVKFRSPVLGAIIYALFGDQQDKQIPDFIMESDPTMLKAFLKGLFMNISWKSLVFNDPGSLYDLSKIMMNLKIPHHVVKKNGRSYQMLVDAKSVEAAINGTQTTFDDNLMWFEGDMCHMVVTSVRGTRAQGYLYDFSVYQDHTYCTGIYAVHNSHLDTPIHSRFMRYRSPMEEYERTRLYGRDAAFWEHPMRDFVEPWMNTMVSSDSLLEGAPRGAFLGSLAFGPPGAIVGTIAGGAYGAGRSILGIDSGVPASVERKRELESYFDKLEYIKANRMYQMTGHQRYKQFADETMTGLDPYDRSKQGWTNMYRAIPYAEKPFFSAFLKTTNPNDRSRILAVAPDEVANLLRIRWDLEEGRRNTKARDDLRRDQDVSSFVRDEGIPEMDWMGWNPNVNLDDIKLKSVEKEGFDAHDFGLGWKDQMRRMDNSPFQFGSVDMTKMTHYDGDFLQQETFTNRHEMQAAIQQIIQSFGAKGSVSVDSIPGSQGIGPTGQQPSQVTINVTRSRSLNSTAFSADSQLSPLEGALLNA